MADLITIGVSKIEVGAIAGDGGMGTTLAVIGKTAEGTASMSTEDPTLTEFYAEESDTALYTSSKAGKTTFNFSLAAPDLAQMAAVFGGTVTGTGNALVWKRPDTAPVIEKSIKITPQAGVVFKIPRGSITAKFSGGFSKNDTLKVDIIITVLLPTKSGEGALIASLLAGEA